MGVWRAGAGGAGGAARSAVTASSARSGLSTASGSSARHRDLMRAYQRQQANDRAAEERGEQGGHSGEMQDYLCKRRRERRVQKPRSGMRAKAALEWHGAGSEHAKDVGRRSRAPGVHQAKALEAQAVAAAACQRAPGAPLGKKRPKLPECAGFRLEHSPRWLRQHSHKHHQARTPRDVSFLLSAVRAHFHQQQAGSSHGVMGVAKWLRKYARFNYNREYRDGSEHRRSGRGKEEGDEELKKRNREVAMEREYDARGHEVVVGEEERARNWRSVRMRHQGTSNTLDLDGFTAALRSLKVSFTADTAVSLFRYFDQDESGRVSIIELQRGICGALSRSRASLLSRTFRHLDADGSGSINMHDLKKRLQMQHHPHVRAGIATKGEVLRGLLTAMDDSGNGMVSREEWDFFFTELSAEVPDDAVFGRMVENVFGLPAAAPAQSKDRKRHGKGLSAEKTRAAALQQQEQEQQLLQASQEYMKNPHLKQLQRRDRHRLLEKQRETVDLKSCVEGRYMLDTRSAYEQRKEAAAGCDGAKPAERLDGHLRGAAARMQLGRTVMHDWFSPRPTTPQAMVRDAARRRGSGTAVRKSCWGDTVHPPIILNEIAWKLRQS